MMIVKEACIMKQFSMRDMGTELDIPKSTLYKWLRDNNKKPAKVGKGGVQLYNEDVYFSVKEAFSKQSSRNTNHGIDEPKVGTETLIDTLRQQNKQLDKQLESLKEQLNVKDEQIKELHRLLDQQQQLNLNTSRLLEHQANESQPQDGTEDEPESEPEAQKEPVQEHTGTKKGLFSRLFK